MKLPAVTLSNNYFSKEGKSFIPIGAHWVPAKTGLQYPLLWNEKDIEEDFKKMIDLGFNTMRFDLFWAWFEPHPGIYNSEAFQQFDFFIQMAHKYQIYLHPTFFIGGEVGEAFWDVPWRQGRHPHADAEMLRLQTNHAAEFARRYKNESAVLAWDLTDEPPFWIVTDKTTDAMAINWTRLIAGAIRRYDPSHVLCVGTSMEDVGHGPFRPDNLADEVDFFSVHPYSIYTLDRFPDAMLSERGTYAGAFQTLLSSGAGKPAMIHEFGASSAQYNPDRIAHFDRVTYYSGLAAGSCGFLPWCFTDAAPELFKQFPYRRAPHETQFGLTTWDRQDRPRGKELRNFSQILAQMDFNGIFPAPADAALIIPHEWAKPLGDLSRSGLTAMHTIPYNPVQDLFPTEEENMWLTRVLLNTFILGRRAGLKVDLPREYTKWQDRPMLLLPSPLASTEKNLVHVHTIFWDEVREYVKNGGIVYVSLCADAAIPEMEDLFGARLSDHTSTSDVAITFTQSLGDIHAGASFRFHADASNPRHWPVTLDMRGGMVLAVDQNMLPALVSNSYGNGKVLLCAYPIETYLSEVPDLFEQPENSHLILKGLAQWAGVRPAFTTNYPEIEIATLNGDRRGYVVLVNHQSEPRKTIITCPVMINQIFVITPEKKENLLLKNYQCTLEIPPYGGAVLEWRL